MSERLKLEPVTREEIRRGGARTMTMFGLRCLKALKEAWKEIDRLKSENGRLKAQRSRLKRKLREEKGHVSGPDCGDSHGDQEEG